MGDDLCLVFRQSLLNTGESYVDSETATIENIMIEDFDGILLTYEKSTDINIVWNDGEYLYTLTGHDIEPETLIMIAQNVK